MSCFEASCLHLSSEKARAIGPHERKKKLRFFHVGTRAGMDGASLRFFPVGAAGGRWVIGTWKRGAGLGDETPRRAGPAYASAEW